MDLDNFSEKYRNIKSPEIQLSDTESDNQNFLRFLEQEETDIKHRYRRMYILYGIGAVVYFSVYTLNPDADLTIANRLAGLSYFFAFLILLIISRKRFSEISQASFLRSPIDFLKAARGRYVFWNKRQLWLIPVIILVNFGTSLLASKYFENLNLFTGILIIQLAFWSLMLFGYIRGKEAWKKKKRPILSKIDKLLAGFAEQ